MCSMKRSRVALDVTLVGDGNHHLFVHDHVLDADVVGSVGYLGTTLVTIFQRQLFELGGNNLQHLGLVREYFLQPAYQRTNFLVLFENLAALESGQALQAHVEDGLGLHQ
jgi:hypothetical protein